MFKRKTIALPEKKSLGDILGVFNSVLTDLQAFVAGHEEEKQSLNVQKEHIEKRIGTIDSETEKALSVQHKMSQLIG